jgi:hypothetical protein
MSVVLFFAVFLISLPSFFICARDRKERGKKGDESRKDFSGENSFLCCGFENLNFSSIIFITLVLSLVLTQMFWGLFFWPFSYLTLGACGLIIFYGFWDSVRVYLRGELTPRKIISNFFITSIILVGVLVTAQWELVV